jgi:deoxycitidine/deoxyadenosine/deoxyguanosine kinase
LLDFILKLIKLLKFILNIVKYGETTMKKQVTKRKTLSIEGNIGAGKSTFLSLVDRWLDTQVVYEPHTKWQEIGGDNLLEKFYNDTSRWAYTFQTYAFISRVVEQENFSRISDKAVQILERSVYSDRYCFAKNCFQMGTMNALEWKLYQEWFSWLVGTFVRPLDGFIYLKTDPEICYKRLLKRNRSEEKEVSLDYLKMIHDKHEQWLIQKQEVDDVSKQVPVLVLECNQDFEHDQAEQEKHMQKISDFFDVLLRFPYQSIKEGRRYL